MKGLIFTYGLTYGGAAVSLLKPIYGLYIYVCFSIVRPAQFWPWSVPRGNYSLTIGIAMLLGWAFAGFGSWKLGRACIVFWALVAFWLWSGLSTIAHPHPVSWDFLDILTKIVVPFTVAITLIRSVDRLAALCWTMVGSIGLVAFQQHEIYFSQRIPVGDNQLAHTMALGAGVAFFLGIQTTKRWQKAIAFGIAALAAHTVLIHMSRGAMLGLAVAGTMTFILLPKSPANILLFALALAIGLRMAGPPVVEEFSTVFADADQRDASAEGRLKFWRAMWEETKANPVLGVGPRQWPLHAERYGFPGREGHGMWQQLAVEVGIPGVAAILAFYGVCAWRLWPLAAGKGRSCERDLRPFAQMAVVGIATWSTAQVFGSFYLVELPYYVALCGAATLRIASAREPMPDGVDARAAFVESSRLRITPATI
jgi:O-antigen ligase